MCTFNVATIFLWLSLHMTYYCVAMTTVHHDTYGVLPFAMILSTLIIMIPKLECYLTGLANFYFCVFTQLLHGYSHAMTVLAVEEMRSVE